MAPIPSKTVEAVTDAGYLNKSSFEFGVWLLLLVNYAKTAVVIILKTI